MLLLTTETATVAAPPDSSDSIKPSARVSALVLFCAIMVMFPAASAKASPWSSAWAPLSITETAKATDPVCPSDLAREADLKSEIAFRRISPPAVNWEVPFIIVLARMSATAAVISIGESNKNPFSSMSSKAFAMIAIFPPAERTVSVTRILEIVFLTSKIPFPTIGFCCMLLAFTCRFPDAIS